jgi:hypothetical protein
MKPGRGYDPSLDTVHEWGNDNREQVAALVGGALAFYTAGRILNQMVDGDPHWDKPFGLVHTGRSTASARSKVTSGVQCLNRGSM